MKWIEDVTQGIVVTGDNDKGSSLNQLYFLNRIVMDQNNAVYIVDGLMALLKAMSLLVEMVKVISEINSRMMSDLKHLNERH